MATTPINGSKMINPLLAPKTPDGGKAKASDKIDPATLLKTDGASVNAQSQKGALATDVTISPSAKRTAEERMKAFSIAKGAPEVREDRVSDIRARIANGTYDVDAGKVADSMMREAVIEHLAETTDRSER